MGIHFVWSTGAVGNTFSSQFSLLRTLWFSIYTRGGGIRGSSGFEHVFLHEIKNNEVSGLHNWIYYHDLEQAKNHPIDFLGVTKQLNLDNVMILFRCFYSSLFVNCSRLFYLESAYYQIPFLIQQHCEADEHNVCWNTPWTWYCTVHVVHCDGKIRLQNFNGRKQIYDQGSSIFPRKTSIGRQHLSTDLGMQLWGWMFFWEKKSNRRVRMLNCYTCYQK